MIVVRLTQGLITAAWILIAVGSFTYAASHVVVADEPWELRQQGVEFVEYAFRLGFLSLPAALVLRATRPGDFSAGWYMSAVIAFHVVPVLAIADLAWHPPCFKTP